MFIKCILTTNLLESTQWFEGSIATLNTAEISKSIFQASLLTLLVTCSFIRPVIRIFNIVIISFIILFNNFL